jgi:[acyl-carrier-protein] S-malonyltransferase
MQPAADKLKDRLAGIEITQPEIPVLHNVDVSSHSDPDKIKEALVQQLYQPVRWVQTIEKMIADGVTDFVECGPGKVLAGLNKRIARRAPVFPVMDKASLEKALSE